MTLDDLGMPHIRVYRDGTVFNELTNNILNSSNGYVYLSTLEGKQQYTVSRTKLYNYCFKTPWRQCIIYPYRHLKSLGFSKYFAILTGHIFGTWNMDYLKEDISDDGYPECVLYDDNSKPHYFKTHRVIALAFVPNPENKDTVNHINGIKTDNNVNNLEWLWNWENMRHALHTGLKHSVMTDDMVIEVCRRLQNNESHLEIASAMNIQRHNIADILDGCHYRIAKDYNINFSKNAKHIPKEFRT